MQKTQGAKMRVAICLLTLNKIEWTKRCLESLFKYTNKDKFDLFVYDNGSANDTINILNKYEIYLFGGIENIGVAKARNFLMKEAIKLKKYSHVCQIHNDMIFTKNWLNDMLFILESDKTIGQLGCSCIVDSKAYLLKDEEIQDVAEALKNSNTGTANLDPRLIPMSTLEKIGLYDEQFSPQECEDVDYNKRVEDAGLKSLSTQKVMVWHAWMQTRTGLPDFEKTCKANQIKMLKKHNIKNFEKWNLSNRKMYTHNDKSYVVCCP